MPFPNLMPRADDERQGTVERVSDSGFGYITDPLTKATYGFRYDDIISYAGQKASEIGLKVGAKLAFKPGPNGKVAYVRLIRR